MSCNYYDLPYLNVKWLKKSYKKYLIDNMGFSNATQYSLNHEGKKPFSSKKYIVGK